MSTDLEILKQDILHYLRAHPYAADSTKGICKWWLQLDGNDFEIQRVQTALDDLVKVEMIQRREWRDGHILYSNINN